MFARKWRRLNLSRIPQRFEQNEHITCTNTDSDLFQRLSRRLHPPAYASKSTLEALVLLKARLTTWGVKAVMIDYAKRKPSEGLNWCVIGSISGTTDRDAASAAVTAAAHIYAMWILVDDTDPLAGQLIELNEQRIDSQAEREKTLIALS